jgi:hypothetical protein
MVKRIPEKLGEKRHAIERGAKTLKKTVPALLWE